MAGGLVCSQTYASVLRRRCHTLAMWWLMREHRQYSPCRHVAIAATLAVRYPTYPHRLPCDARCSRKLACGHRCPGLCGEECPPARFCVDPACMASAPEKVKDQVGRAVSFIVLQLLGNNISHAPRRGSWCPFSAWNSPADGLPAGARLVAGAGAGERENAARRRERAVWRVAELHCPILTDGTHARKLPLRPDGRHLRHALL